MTRPVEGAERFDIVSSAVRSRIMSSVGQADTSAELAVRRLASAAGLRYRVRNRDLPGSPDLANRRRRWVIFVHGCFWHGHKNCPKTKSGAAFRVPRTNSESWHAKLSNNRRRDGKAIRRLREDGYKVLLIWECELRDPEVVLQRLGRLRAETSESERAR